MRYLIPQTPEQAMEFLQEGNARIIAGGTDLVLELQAGKLEPRALIDITRIGPLGRIEEANGTITLGGAVTHARAAASPLLRARAAALAEGCRAVGSRQIRNVATIAGNIVNAQPAADSAVPLAVLDPLFHIRTHGGRVRTAGMRQMYAGFGKSTLDSSSELLTDIQIQAEGPEEGSAYIRLELRASLALPMLCVAAKVQLAGDTIARASIAMAPVGVGPVRASAAEQWLMGRPFRRETLLRAGELALENADPRSNLLRGSREYRMQTLPVLVARALEKAGERAEKKGGQVLS